MRYVPIILFAATVASGCGKRTVADAQPVNVATPPPSAALIAADAFLNSEEPGGRPAELYQAGSQFAENFVTSYTDLRVVLIDGTHETIRGFGAGREYRSAYPDKITQTMEKLGFTETTAEGTWTYEPYPGSFVPGSKPGETWLLNKFGGVQCMLDYTKRRKESTAVIRITGFLGPTGGQPKKFGCDRIMYVTKAARIDGP